MFIFLSLFTCRALHALNDRLLQINRKQAENKKRSKRDKDLQAGHQLNVFQNEFMEEFSVDAFDNRRAYITGWYLEGKENLDREYPYLTEAEMDAFVEETSRSIFGILHTNYGLNM